FFFFQAEDGIRDGHVTGVQTCALPICIANGEYARPHVSGHRPSLRLCDAAGVERDAALYQAPAAEVASPPRLSLDAAHSRRWSEIGRASCREKSVDLGCRRIIEKKKIW